MANLKLAIRAIKKVCSMIKAHEKIGQPINRPMGVASL